MGLTVGGEEAGEGGQEDVEDAGEENVGVNDDDDEDV